MVAARRRDLVAAILGPERDDLRVTQLAAADIRKDAALLDTELKARGFFPGRRIVVVDGGTDGLTKTVDSVVETTTADDAFLVVTAGMLPARSKLRGLFEKTSGLIALQQFQEAPGPAEIEALLQDAGMKTGVDGNALHSLGGIAQSMDYGSFLQLVETISVFKSDSNDPLTVEEVEKIAPTGQDAEIDRFVDAVAHGRADEIGQILRRLEAGSVNAVSLLIALQRQFRQLLLASSAPGGPEAGLALIRPPLWGPRKSAMQSLLRRWGLRRIEQAVQVLFDADSKVRSSGNAPAMAVVERCALRLAMMAKGSG